MFLIAITAALAVLNGKTIYSEPLVTTAVLTTVAVILAFLFAGISTASDTSRRVQSDRQILILY